MSDVSAQALAAASVYDLMQCMFVCLRDEPVCVFPRTYVVLLMSHEQAETPNAV